MNYDQFLVWNARGLNSRARRTAVRDILVLERASVVCLQETKVASFSVRMISELMGLDFDYSFLPSVGVSGGVLIGWRRDCWRGAHTEIAAFSVTVHLFPVDGTVGADFWLTAVYGPTDHALKEDFLRELENLAATCSGSWVICGDFNLIYQVQDKNNNRLNRRLMRRFRRTIDDLQLAELHLHGRLFTWSNERIRPTLERIDRVFATVSWLERHPFHHLHSRSTDCSDHAPLLLVLCTEPWARPRFRFQSFWPEIDGFLDVVAAAWASSLPLADAC